MISLNQYKKSMLPKDNSWAHSNNIAHGSPQNSFGQSQRVPEHSRMQYKSNYNTLTTKYNKKAPLEDSASAQVNFKGAFDRSFGKILTPAIETVSREGLDCLITTVKHNSSSQKAKQYKDYVTNYLVKLFTDEAFHPHIQKEIKKGLGESFAEIAKAVSESSKELETILADAVKTKEILNIIEKSINILEGKPEYAHLKEFAQAAKNQDEKKLKPFLENLLKDKHYHKDFQEVLLQNSSYNKVNSRYKQEAKKLETILDEQIISKGQLKYAPSKNLAVRIANGFVDPILDKINSGAIKLAKKINPDSPIVKRAEAYEKYSKINEKFANIPATLEAINIEKAKNPYITDKEIGRMIASKDAKAFNYNKHANFSSSHLSTGNRIISGTLTAVYLGTDSYNTVMKIKNDKEMAEQERRSRLAQEGARVGLTAYLQITATTIFKHLCDKSMPAALIVSAAVVGISEVIGRAMIGKPILPKSKEQLDAMDEKMKNNNGIMRKIGGLLTKDTAPKATQPAPQPQKTAVAFSGGLRNAVRGIARGYEKTFIKDANYSVGEVKKLLHLIGMADADKARLIKKNIDNGLLKASNIEKNVKTLDTLADDAIISIGKKALRRKVVIESVFKPLYLAKKWSLDLVNLTEKGLKSIKVIGEPTADKKLTRILEKIEDKNLNVHFEDRKANMIEKLVDELQEKLAKATKADDKEKIKEFSSKLANLKTKSGENKSYNVLSDEQQLEIAEKFVKIEEYAHAKLEGIQNLFSIVKEIKAKAEKEGKNVVDEIRNELAIKVNKTLGDTAGASYDASKFAILNVNLARAVTGLFLINDAYNLTMQLSNGNKQESVDSGKKRLFQEVSRTAFSTYLISLTHNIFSRFHNSALRGALSITAANVLFNEALSRKTVGMAVLPSSKAELEKIEQDNQNSKNPIVKFIGGVIGKKRSNSPQPSQKPAAQVALAGRNGKLDQTKAAMMYVSHANNSTSATQENDRKVFEMLKAKKVAV